MFVVYENKDSERVSKSFYGEDLSIDGFWVRDEILWHEDVKDMGSFQAITALPGAEDFSLLFFQQEKSNKD